MDGSLRILLRDATHRRNLVLYIGTWIVASFCYFMTYFQLKYLRGDIFLNTIVAALSEMTGYIITGFSY